MIERFEIECVLRVMDDAARTKPITYSCRELKQVWWKKLSIHKPGVDTVTGVCLLMLLIHGVVSLQGGVIAHEELYTQWLGLSVEGLLAGKVWQLVTYAFLHGSWFHLLTNILVIWLIGGRVLSTFNQKRVALCLLSGTFLGGLFFICFDLLTSYDTILVGASGAVFACFVLMACISPNVKLIPIPIRAKNMAIGLLSSSLLLSLAHPGLSLPGFTAFYDMLEQAGLGSIFIISHSCHLGGGLAGIWLSRKIMGKMVSLEDLARTRID